MATPVAVQWPTDQISLYRHGSVPTMSGCLCSFDFLSGSG